MKTRLRLAGTIGGLVLAMLLGACEDAIGPGIEVDVGEVVLHVGSASTTVRAGNPAALTVNEGTHDVSISARDLDGRPVSLGIDYELDIATSSQAVARYSPLSNLRGTLVTAPGTATLQVHIDHGNHTHFAAPVTITVN